MLVTKSGFNAFNEYDLSQTLNSQLDDIKNKVKSKLNTEIPKDIDEFIKENVSANTIEMLEIDVAGIYMEEAQPTMIDAAQFPGDFYVRSGSSYEKDVLTFHLPYKGDKTLLKSVPTTRILWTEKIAIEDHTIVFQFINFHDNQEQIKLKVDKMVKFLSDQSNHINKQVDTFNTGLEKALRAIIDEEIESRKSKAEFITGLGYKIKTGSSRNISIAGKELEVEAEKNIKIYDVFISHASSDKDYVDKLAKTLRKAGIEVWYDTFELQWGDNIRRSIDKGLKNSKFGLVVLSEDFLSKRKWTEYELDGFFSVEEIDKKFVLPLWHNVTIDQVREYSPTLADVTSLNSDQESEIIKQLKRLLEEKDK